MSSQKADTASDEYTLPTEECDLVMKGGVTSGIVYPHAVCQLARQYRFRSIGGTSAGAIAAAAAAAAECGRDSREGGFAALERLPTWLSEESHLFRLFQPQPKTASLFSVATAYMRGGGGNLRRVLRTIRVAVARHWQAAVLGSAAGVALVVAALLSATGWFLLTLSLVGGLLLAVAGSLLAVSLALFRHVNRALPENGFGLCSGLTEPGLGQLALTDWLADLLDDLAGKTDPTRPLTFEDLTSQGVQLVMLTSNLNHGIPYEVPFDTRIFYYDPAEFRKLFPARIVGWLEREEVRPTARDERQAREWQQRLPRRPLPDPAKLPVVVGVRMSLSFPLLLSAVPLWAVDYGSDNRELKRAWFSDGGICSNFPMHFFDAPFPRRPTFGINLRPSESVEAEQSDNVHLGSASRGIVPRWSNVVGVWGFLWAVLDTMQNWGDNAQLRFPGYRDRVAHVNHGAHEGGLNLNMPPEVISAMVERGAWAGRKLVTDFDWVNHRWTRYRSTMGVLEGFLESLQSGYRDAPRPTYAELIARTENEPLTSYMTDWSGPMAAFAEETTEGLVELADGWLKAERSFRTEDAPDPKPHLRVAPDF